MNSSQYEVIEIWGKVHNTIFTALTDSIGKEKLKDALYQPLKRLGQQSAQEINGDAQTAGEAIMQIEQYWKIEGRVVESNRSKFVREVSHCPWSYFKPMSCKVLAWYMEGFCEAINPNCRYKLEKLIPEGSDVCIWSVTCKDDGLVNNMPQ